MIRIFYIVTFTYLSISCSTKTIERQYHDNGAIKNEYSTESKLKHGVEKWYYPDGKLESKFHWENGLKNGLYQKYHENGNLIIEGYFVDDKRSGLQKEYDSLGNLIGEIPYKDDVEEGVARVYYPENNTLFKEYNYVSGNLSGPQKVYYSGGSVKEYYYSVQDTAKYGKRYNEKGDVLGGLLWYEIEVIEDSFQTKKIRFELKHSNIDSLMIVVFFDDDFDDSGMVKDESSKYYNSGSEILVDMTPQLATKDIINGTIGEVNLKTSEIELYQKFQLSNSK